MANPHPGAGDPREVRSAFSTQRVAFARAGETRSAGLGSAPITRVFGQVWGQRASRGELLRRRADGPVIAGASGAGSGKDHAGRTPEL